MGIITDMRCNELTDLSGSQAAPISCPLGAYLPPALNLT